MAEKSTKLRLYLKELRITKDLSLRDVEKKTQGEVSNAYLSQLESGKIAKPSPHILQHLATAYQVAYDSLMIAAGYMEPSKKGESGVAFFNDSDITAEEKEELLDYLKLMRKHRNRPAQ